MSKKIALVFFVLFSFCGFVFAQNPDPGGGEEPRGFECTPPCEANFTCVEGNCVCINWRECGPCGGWTPVHDCQLPIDENIWILILFGISMGVFQFFKSHKRGA